MWKKFIKKVKFLHFRLNNKVVSGENALERVSDVSRYQGVIMKENTAQKETYKIGVTHGGRFHSDDVLSTALLKALFPEITVIRMVNYDAEQVPQGVWSRWTGEWTFSR